MVCDYAYRYATIVGVNDCVADLWIGDGINCDVDFVCLVNLLDNVVFTCGAGGKVNLNR